MSLTGFPGCSFIPCAVIALLMGGAACSSSPEIPPDPRPKISIIKQGDGSGLVYSEPNGIHCSADCQEHFDAGTRVWLYIKPEARSSFIGWEGACTGDGPSCTLDITASTEVTVRFKAQQCSAAGWCRETNHPAGNQTLVGISGKGEPDVWIAGHGGTLLRWDGVAWRAIPTNVGTNLYAVSAYSRFDVVVVGAGGQILQFDGMEWISNLISSRNALFGALADFAGDGWVVGAGGELYTLDRFQLTASSTFSSQVLTSLYLDPDGLSWVGGENGVLLKGQRFIGMTPVTSGTTQHIYSMSGTAANNILAVGSGGATLRYNGSTWTGIPSNTSVDLLGVWASSYSDAWAVGNNGVILHWDGTNWSSSASGTTESLQAVWGSSDRDVWAVGVNGTILHRRT